ncbi:MAG: AMP-binding protein, partial [Bacteroidota bacterium]
LLQMIEREKISIWYSVPLVMIQMLKSGALDQHDLSCLRWVKFGGEAFGAQQLAELMPHMPNATFCNVYGPAEVNQCTYFHIREPLSNNQTIPLGYVWDNTDILIVDNDNEVVEAGEVGELLVSSTTMMRGYWDDEKLNSRAFFTRVGTDTKPRTYYRTGDLVCTSAGGDYPHGPNGENLLYFIGRKDRQIKTRGYRVELAEVELALLSQEDIAEATVMALDNGEEGKLIKAFLVVKREIDINDLKKSLSSILPSYALPSSWELLDKIPRTRNGKVDYKALTKVYT